MHIGSSRSNSFGLIIKLHVRNYTAALEEEKLNVYKNLPPRLQKYSKEKERNAIRILLF